MIGVLTFSVRKALRRDRRRQRRSGRGNYDGVRTRFRCSRARALRRGPALARWLLQGEAPPDIHPRGLVSDGRATRRHPAVWRDALGFLRAHPQGRITDPDEAESRKGAKVVNSGDHARDDLR